MTDENKTVKCKFCDDDFPPGELTLYGICEACYEDLDIGDREEQLEFLLTGGCKTCED